MLINELDPRQKQTLKYV